MRALEQKELCHDRLGERFLRALSIYDTQRRVETLIGQFLRGHDLNGKLALDVGCGFGFFSAELQKRGATVTACDIGPNLVEATARRVGCTAVVADALSLEEQFGRDTFDIVLSSECIEHTPSPQRALTEMVRVLRPGGTLVLSTPNLLWEPVVRLATMLRLRPFDGHENFLSWEALRSCLKSEGVVVRAEYGLHLFPFQLPLHALSRALDQRCQAIRWLMINICVMGEKLGRSSEGDSYDGSRGLSCARPET